MIKINLEKDKRYLLACSYGPDSMALFDLLQQGGYIFEVAHVNYGLRPEADFETEGLTKYCKRNDIRITTLKVTQKIETNIEEKCREIRYEFFKNLVSKKKFDAVLIAHNEDDLLETFFLQKKRKGIYEHFGLAECSDSHGFNVIRPLLSYSKKELEIYDIRNGVPFAIDSSNNEDKFERNKIRHHLVQKMNDKVREDTILEIDSLNANMKKHHDEIVSANPKDISELIKYSDEDLAYYFTKLCRKYIKKYELSLRQVKEFRKVMLSDKPNVIINLKDNLNFIKSYDKATIKELPEGTNFCFVVDKPCKFDCEFFYLDFTKGSLNRNVKPKDYPITIRNASNDDEMEIKDYKTTMRRQFINWKMPKELRGRWPIILNNKNEIVYVPKYDPDFKPENDTNFYVVI